MKYVENDSNYYYFTIVTNILKPLWLKGFKGGSSHSKGLKGLKNNFFVVI